MEKRLFADAEPNEIHDSELQAWEQSLYDELSRHLQRDISMLRQEGQDQAGSSEQVIQGKHQEQQRESAKVYILESSSLQAGSLETHIQEIDLPLLTEQIEQYAQRHKLLEAFIDPKKQEASSSHWQKQKEIIEIVSDSELNDNNTEKDWKAISIELNANIEDMEKICQKFKIHKKMRKSSQDSTSDSTIAKSFINSLPEKYRQAYSYYRSKNIYSKEGEAIYHL